MIISINFGFTNPKSYQLNSLKCRTGAETILYTTRGSTDLPLRGVSFATEGVQTFMGSVMGIDGQDLVSKMEGFAVQGIKGLFLCIELVPII
jgi:hypothetical protein